MAKGNEIYLDNASTTKVDKKVVKVMKDYFSDKYGNSSSQHSKGQEASEALNWSRKIIAEKINSSPEEIIFTSGGTESNNLAIKGLAFMDERKKGKKGHLIISEIEHDCVLKAAEWLKEKGWQLTYLKVDDEGFIDLEDLKGEIREDTFLVSIIHGNNEIGTVQNLKEISKICQNKGVFFHTDACQSFTKEELDVKNQNLSLMTMNSHKIHGPKGVGALYVKEGIKLESLHHGGSQEKGLRSGTENVPGIVGFAKAVELVKDTDIKKIRKLRDRLISGLGNIGDSIFNGPEEDSLRLCNIVNFTFKGAEGEAITAHLNSYGIHISTGSACSSNDLRPSHVLLAIDRSEIEAHGSIRLSLSKYNTKEEIDKVIKVMPDIINKLREISPFNKENGKES